MLEVSKMRRAVHIDNRNYDKEAQEVIKNLSDQELYKLYEIVLDQKQKRNSRERDNELFAVQKAIETKKGVDYTRLKNLQHGYKSSMAQEAGLGDLIANNNPKKKKS